MKPAATLIAFLLAASGAQAASVVLYETGWEATPASPAWLAGNVTPQNSWLSSGAGPDRHRVVANGSTDANPFGTPVTTPYGSQFHRFRASSSTTTAGGQWAWPDLSAAFTNRPAGFDRLTGSIDMFVPSGDSSDGSVYGLFGYDDTTEGNFLDFGFLVVPANRTIMLLTNGVIAGGVDGAFSYNQWFNVAVQVNYQSGEVSVLYNDVPLPGLTEINPFIVDSSFTDLDLFCQNLPSSPNPTRIIFSDNYRVLLDPLTPVFPQLTIEPGPPGPIGDPPTWRLSWHARYADWILESAQDIDQFPWTNEGVTPSVSGNVASVELPEAPPRTFYRLRQP